MSKDGTMTFRVEPALRELFNDVAKSEHRPAAQVLRELMRGYIAQVTGQTTPSQPIISDAERTRRQDAFNAALASVGLEGFTVSPEYQAAAQQFINGNVEFSAFMQTVHEQASRQ